jgi:hypothetical protein
MKATWTLTTVAPTHWNLIANTFLEDKAED